MGQSHSFTQYVSRRFEDELSSAILNFLRNDIEKADLNPHYVRNIGSWEMTDDFEIKSVRVNDQPEMKIQFDVIVEAGIYVRNSDHHFDKDETCFQWFMIRCMGDLEKKLDDFSIIEPVQVYSGSRKFDNPLFDSLVPFIKAERFDKEANNFLKKYYPMALVQPCAVDPIKLAENMGLAVKFVHIKDDASVFGRCYFRECETELYDPNTKSFYKTVIPEKTILVDEDVYFLRNVGCMNNTIVHECVHWDKHRKAFALAELYTSELSSIECCVAGGMSKHEKDEFDWMEWHANSLAPRIQMPIEMFKKQVERFKSEIRFETGEYDMIDIIEPLIDRLAKFFGVSRIAAKIRMVETGCEEAVGAFNYIDGHYVSPHKSGKRLEKNQTFSIPVQDAAILSYVDENFKQKISNCPYLFVDNHFVLNSPLYLEQDDNGKLQLTHYARSHMDECCLVFNLSLITKCGEKYHSECFLNRDKESNVSFNVTFHNGFENSSRENQLKAIQRTLEEENQLRSLLRSDYADTLQAIIDYKNQQIKRERKKKNDSSIPLIDASYIRDCIGDEGDTLHIDTIRRTLRGEKTSIKTLVLICLALHLPYSISTHIIESSPVKFDLKRNVNHQYYDFALRVHYAETVKTVRDKLIEYGAEPLV